MKPVLKWAKLVACMALAVAVLLSVGGVYADAASGKITVTNLNGDELYNGDDLQAAFDAAERASVVSLGRSVKLTADVILDVEVMITGNRISCGDYRILLTGDGALYTENRFKVKEIAALYSYSEVTWQEEGNGYVYYLLTTAPSMEGKVPEISVSGNLLGAKLDEENGIIYLDAVAGGITTDAMAKLISMTADYAEAVEYSFTGTATVNGKTCVANGCTMVASAVNYDYAQTVKKTYTIVLLGDVNGNGRVDSADASLIACHANGSKTLDDSLLAAADANQDGQITAADAELICNKYVKASSYDSPL